MLSRTPTTVNVPPTMASTEVKKSYHLRLRCLMCTLIGLRSKLNLASGTWDVSHKHKHTSTGKQQRDKTISEGHCETAN